MCSWCSLLAEYDNYWQEIEKFSLLLQTDVVDLRRLQILWYHSKERWHYIPFSWIWVDSMLASSTCILCMWHYGNTALKIGSVHFLSPRTLALEDLLRVSQQVCLLWDHQVVKSSKHVDRRIGGGGRDRERGREEWGKGGSELGTKKHRHTRYVTEETILEVDIPVPLPKAETWIRDDPPLQVLPKFLTHKIMNQVLV